MEIILKQVLQKGEDPIFYTGEYRIVFGYENNRKQNGVCI